MPSRGYTQLNICYFQASLPPLHHFKLKPFPPYLINCKNLFTSSEGLKGWTVSSVLEPGCGDTHKLRWTGENSMTTRCRVPVTSRCWYQENSFWTTINCKLFLSSTFLGIILSKIPRSKGSLFSSKSLRSAILSSAETKLTSSRLDTLNIIYNYLNSRNFL